MPSSGERTKLKSGAGSRSGVRAMGPSGLRLASAASGPVVEASPPPTGSITRSATCEQAVTANTAPQTDIADTVRARDSECFMLEGLATCVPARAKTRGAVSTARAYGLQCLVHAHRQRTVR